MSVDSVASGETARNWTKESCALILAAESARRNVSVIMGFIGVVVIIFANVPHHLSRTAGATDASERSEPASGVTAGRD